MTSDLLRKKVLLAEDDEDDRHFFQDFLSGHSRVELLPSVTNGAEVLAYLDTVSSNSALPDLIILDQNMPKMNGRETLTQLKADPRWSSIPVVVYSTYKDSTLVADCTRLGAAAVKAKPDSEEGYLELMEGCLEVVK